MNTFGEAKKQAAAWKMIALLDTDKEALKPFNNYNKEPRQQLKEIEEIIPSLPDGKYFLAVKSSPRSKEQLHAFQVGATPAPMADSHTASDELHRENLRLAVRNKELETLNEIQEQKIQELIRTNADLEDELEAIEESAQALAEPATPSMWETMAATAMPLLLEKFGLTGSQPMAAGPSQLPDAPGGGTPPPIPGVNVTAAKRFVINPATTNVPAQVVANVQQGKALLNSLGELDKKFLVSLAWILQPLASTIDNDLEQGKIKWQQAKAVKNYLDRNEAFSVDGYEPASQAILNAALQIGFLLYGGDEMKQAAGTIEQNFETLMQWANR